MKKFKLRGPRVFALGLYLVFLLDGVMYGSWLAVIATAQAAMGLGVKHLGYALFGLPIGMLVGMLVSRWLIERFALPVCSVAVILYPALVCLPGWAEGWSSVEGWPALFLALTPFGLAKGMLEASMNLLANRFARRMDSMLQGPLNAVLTVGGALAAFAAGFFLKTVDVETYLNRMAIIGAFAAVVACVLMLASGEGRERERSAEPSQPPSRIGGWLVAVCSLTFVSFVAEGMFGEWHGPYLTKEAGISAFAAGCVFATFAGAEALARLVTPPLARKFGNEGVALGGGVLAFFGSALFVAAEQLPEALFGALLLGAGVGPIVPLAFAAAGDKPGRVVALSTTGYVGMTGGPPAIGVLADEFRSLRLALGVLMGLAAVAVCLWKAARIRPGWCELFGIYGGTELGKALSELRLIAGAAERARKVAGKAKLPGRPTRVGLIAKGAEVRPVQATALQLRRWQGIPSMLVFVEVPGHLFALRWVRLAHGPERFVVDYRGDESYDDLTADFGDRDAAVNFLLILLGYYWRHVWDSKVECELRALNSTVTRLSRDPARRPIDRQFKLDGGGRPIYESPDRRDLMRRASRLATALWLPLPDKEILVGQWVLGPGSAPALVLFHTGQADERVRPLDDPATAIRDRLEAFRGIEGDGLRLELLRRQPGRKDSSLKHCVWFLGGRRLLIPFGARGSLVFELDRAHE